jgi:hypothetical protein
VFLPTLGWFVSFGWVGLGGSDVSDVFWMAALQAAFDRVAAEIQVRAVCCWVCGPCRSASSHLGCQGFTGLQGARVLGC